MEQAQAELEQIGRRATAAFPKTHATLRPMVMPYVHSLTDIQGVTTLQVVTMQLMVSMLLIVVALNVAVLIYARTAMRAGRDRGAHCARREPAAHRCAALHRSARALGRISGGRTRHRASRHWVGQPTVQEPVREAVLGGVQPAAVERALRNGRSPSSRPRSSAFSRHCKPRGSGCRHDIRQMGGSTGMRLGKTWTALIVARWPSRSRRCRPPPTWGGIRSAMQ